MRRSWTAPSAPQSVGSELPPVDSNHHSRIQSPMSCRWTRGHQSPETYPPVVTPTTFVDVREINPLIGEAASAFSASACESKTPMTDDPEPASMLITAPCWRNDA